MMEQALENIRVLPKGWKWTKLGEVCLKPQYGWTTRAVAEGTIHLLRTSDITSGNIDWNSIPFCENEPLDKEKYLIKDGDIVISRAGSVGYSHLIRNPEKAVFASYLIRFRPLIDGHYLAFFLQSPSYWKSISEKTLGIAIPNVNASKLKQISLPLPPLSEQNRIVTKIEELFTRLDAGVQALKKAREQLKRYRQSVLKSAFEGKLMEQWRKENNYKIEPASVLLERIKEERRKSGKKFQELSPVDTSELPPLPEGWMWSRLGEIISPSDERYNPRESSIKEIFIGLEHIQSDLGEIVGYGHSSDIRSTKTRFHKGDVLYGKLRPYLNKVCVPAFDGICSTDILVFPQNDFIESKYLARFLITSEFVRYASQNMSGVQHPRVSFKVLSQYVIPLAPYEEQKTISAEIERHLSIANNAERTIEQSLAHADRLKQSILKQAFEGKLVPQDPTDEPATVLLERIKAEKAEHEGKNKDEQKDRPKIQKRRNKSYRMDSRQRRLV